MTELTLFFAPDTCARVSMIALEETEHPYETELIAFDVEAITDFHIAIEPRQT
jgi:hypothetical protein